MKVLCTGSEGFIGKHLCRALRGHGDEVIGLDRVGKPDVHMTLGWTKTWEEHLQSVLKDVDAVVHLAGWASPKDYIMPKRGNETIRVAKGLAKFLDDRPIVFASTAQVYGSPQYSPIDEQHPCAPSNGYAEAKLKAEKEFHRPSSAILRLFNVYGPGQDKAVTYQSAFVPDMVRQRLEGSVATIIGDPETTRDFVYIDDVVSAIDIVIRYLAGAPRLQEWLIYNLGSGTGSSLKQVVDILFDHSPRTEYVPLSVSGPMVVPLSWTTTLSTGPASNVVQIGKWRLWAADTSRLRKLGWYPKVSLQEGLRRTYEAMKG